MKVGKRTARPTLCAVLNARRSRPSSDHDGASRMVKRSRSSVANTRSSGMPIAQARPMLCSMSLGRMPPYMTSRLLDVDAVDALVKVPLLVAVEARRHVAQVGRQTLDPQVARLDDVPVGVGQLGDRHAGLLQLSAGPVARPATRCQSSDLIRRPPGPGFRRPLSRPRRWSTRERMTDRVRVERLKPVGGTPRRRVGRRAREHHARTR